MVDYGSVENDNQVYMNLWCFALKIVNTSIIYLWLTFSDWLYNSLFAWQYKNKYKNLQNNKWFLFTWYGVFNMHNELNI